MIVKLCVGMHVLPTQKLGVGMHVPPTQKLSVAISQRSMVRQPTSDELELK